MNARPLGNRIFVEPIHRGQSALIVEVEKYRADPFEWRVTAVGPGRLKGDGTREPIPVEVGWRVMCHAYSAKHLEFQGQKLRILDWSDVLMVLPP